jgi:putative ABC transport system permease protein
LSEPTGGTPGGKVGRRRSGRFVASGRARLAALGSAPWLKAPILLFRFPGLLLAMASAVLILAVATAAGPLFLSSAGNATLHRSLREMCSWDAGLAMRIPAPLTGESFYFGLLGPPMETRTAVEALVQVDGQVRRSFRSIESTRPVQWSIVGSSLTVTKPGTELQFGSIRLLTQDGWRSHIHQLSSAGGDGIWLPDNVASQLKVRAGERVAFRGPDRTVKVRVAGTYTNLSQSPRTPFWCGQESLIYPYSAFASRPPPPLVLSDRSTFLNLGRRLGERGSIVTWNVPIREEGLTVGEAHEAVAATQAKVDELFRRGFGSKIEFGLPFIADLASATEDSMRGTVETVSLAGRLVALIVIGAAGIYWVNRRRVEVGLLTARGSSPSSLGAKVLLEVLLVAAAAGLAGWFVALWLVRRFGPTSLLEPGAPTSALRAVLWTVAAALVILAVITAFAVRKEGETTGPRSRRALSRAPWEVPVLILAAASLYEIFSRRPPHVTDVRVPVKPDVLILLFPILFIAGMAGLATRVLHRLLPRLRSAGHGWAPAFYLSSRRLSSAPQAALTLLTVAALAIGILAYAGALSASQAASARAKAQVFVGSDVSVNLAISNPLPKRLPFPTTRITRVTNGELMGLSHGSNGVDLLGIEPASFPAVAYWDRSFSTSSLAGLIQNLRSAPSQPLPAISVGGSIRRLGTIQAGAKTVPYRVIGVARDFAGLHADRPMLVTTRHALRQRDLGGIEQLWAKGDPGSILTTLRSTGSIIEGSEALAEETQELPQFTSLRWGLGFLQALGIVTGLIALGGIVLYLESRQRSREVSYALARRMGLSRGEHRRSIGLELAAMLGVGVVMGVGLAWLAARIVYGRLDPMPLLPPSPLFRSPYLLLGVTASCALLASWIGAWRVHRTAERANVAEVMRVAP